MRKNVSRIFRSHYFWIVIVSFSWSLVICRTYTPILLIRETGIDSTMWITMARRMLTGDVLYRDIWDSKGPWIVLVNVLGLWLHPEYGLFVVEAIHFVVVYIFIFKILNLYLPFRKAFVIGSIWPLLVPFFFIEYSNTCNAYCLPWICAAVYGMCLWVKQEQHDTHCYSWAFIYGLSVGCCFMTRPSNALIVLVGVVFIFIVLLFYKQFLSAFINLFFGTLGIFVFCLPFFVYAFLNGVVYDMLYATFIYNFKYSAIMSERFVVSGSLVIVLIVYLYGVFGSLIVVSQVIHKRDLFSLLYVMMFLVTSFYLTMGACFIHYYSVLLPVFVVFICILLNNIQYFLVILSLLLNCCVAMVIGSVHFSYGSSIFANSFGSLVNDYIPLSGELLIINRGNHGGNYVTYFNRPNLPRTKWILFQDFVYTVDESFKDSILADFCRFEPEYVYYGDAGIANVTVSFDDSVFHDVLLRDYDLLYIMDNGDMIFKRCDVV